MGDDPISTRLARCARGRDRAARRARRTVALVDVSSPSGDAEAAERAVAAPRPMLPAGAEVERIECSSPDHAPDLLARVTGTGTARLLLVGHLDTVVAHERHRPAADRWRPPARLGHRRHEGRGRDRARRVARSRRMPRRVRRGRAAAGQRRGVPHRRLRPRPAVRADSTRASASRAASVSPTAARPSSSSARPPPRSASRPAASPRTPAPIPTRAERPARAGRRCPGARRDARPDRGRGAHRRSDDDQRRRGDQRRSGDGELLVDMRADAESSFGPVLAAVPAELDGVPLQIEVLRLWPAIDARESRRAAARAAELLGRPIAPAARGGASDASNSPPTSRSRSTGSARSAATPTTRRSTCDLGSTGPRAEVALALAAAVLDAASRGPAWSRAGTFQRGERGETDGAQAGQVGSREGRSDHGRGPGIGKSTATALVRRGARVAIGDLDLALAEQTADELGGRPSPSSSTSPTATPSRASSTPPRRSSGRSTC